MWLLGLLGCNYISQDLLEEYRDLDRDGVDDLEDCDRADASIGAARVWYPDADGDGFGVPEGALTACAAPGAFTAAAGDCDDLDPDVNPDAAEACNGRDDDCDGRIDDDDDAVEGRTAWFVDLDGDGVPGATSVLRCEPAAGQYALPERADCDDADPARSPGTPELCANGMDDDCDGRTDDVGEGAPLRWPDLDGDGFTAAASSPRCAADEAGWLPSPTASADCDDARADVSPDGEEIPDDGVDQDCSGTDRRTCFADADGDGWTPGSTTLVDLAACPPVLLGDCDDGDPLASPDLEEVCANGRDDDCDGRTDDLGLDPVERWRDADLDGSAVADGELRCAAQEEGWLDAAPSTPDCDDDDAERAPGRLDVPDDGIDQDCTGFERLTCAIDDDGDGHAGALTELLDTDACPAVLGTGDCDDSDPDVLPDRLLYRDADGDGVPGTSSELRCAALDEPGWRPEPADGAFDCDDADEAFHPGAPEVADDGQDQDCNGIDATICPRDADGDGFGVPGTQVDLDGTCDEVLAAEEDCDDTRADVAPGRVEWCDEIDHDCDGALASSPTATRWTGTTPGALPTLEGATIAAGQVVKVCGGGLWAGPVTVAGGALTRVAGEPTPTLRAGASAAGLTLTGGRVEGFQLTGIAGTVETVRIAGGTLADSAVTAAGRPTGVRFAGAGALEGVSISGASGAGLMVGDLVTRLPGSVRGSALTLSGNGRPIDAFVDELVLEGVQIGPHGSGARVRGRSLELVDAVIAQGGTAGPNPLLDLQSTDSLLERVELSGGPSAGLRVQGDSELVDVVSRDHVGDGLALVGGDHLLERVEVRGARVGVVNGAGLLVGRELVVAQNRLGGIQQSGGFQILDEPQIADNLGPGLAVGPAALAFVEGGALERNAGSAVGGAHVQGVARFTATSIRQNTGGGLRAEAGSELRLFDSVVQANTATLGAGLRVEGNALVIVSGGAFLDHATGGAVAVGGHRGSVQYGAGGTRFSGNAVDLVFASGFESCTQDPTYYYEVCEGASVLYGSGLVSQDDFAVQVGGLTCPLGPVGYATCQCESTYDPGNYSSANYCWCTTDRGACGGPSPCEYEGGDGDGDGVCDYYDSCSGQGQVDDDYDGLCDDRSCPDTDCDPCPGDGSNTCSDVCTYYPDDQDGDGTCDAQDPCPQDYGTYDDDGDGLCDSDPCPGDSSNTCSTCSTDSDGDGTCDESDPCPYDYGTYDDDGDGLCDGDPCPGDSSNLCQGDTDTDVYDTDTDVYDTDTDVYDTDTDVYDTDTDTDW